jgi:quercetin dioxygenase-like cupin family protein
MSSGKWFLKGKWKVIQVLAILGVLVGSVIWARTSQATPPATPGSGVTVVTLADGRLPAIVRVIVGPNSDNKVARIQQYKITLVPGGTTGWHQHGGPHPIVVASGTLTYYKGDDATCTGVQYPAGTAILDPGYTTHLARNEGTVDVVLYVTQMLPDPGIFRIDIPAPGNPHCGF